MELNSTKGIIPLCLPRSNPLRIISVPALPNPTCIKLPMRSIVLIKNEVSIPWQSIIWVANNVDWMMNGITMDWFTFEYFVPPIRVIMICILFFHKSFILRRTTHKLEEWNICNIRSMLTFPWLTFDIPKDLSLAWIEVQSYVRLVQLQVSWQGLQMQLHQWSKWLK